MKVSANTYCNLLMEIATEHGVRTVVCSPGSRNAPLLIAAAGITVPTRVIVDERVAAFVALGEATVSRRPVMLVCTSGTALLNYAPAVAEAFYAGIPLIVVSADRPQEWIDQDDSQTIRQPGALRNIVKRSFDLPVFSEDESCGPSGGASSKSNGRGAALRWFVERSVNDAMLTALAPKQGPVHINIQLDVPLGKLADPQETAPRVIRTLFPVREYDREMVRDLARQCAGKRVMLVAGFMRPDERLTQAFAMLSAQKNVCVMAENVSNLDAARAKRNLSGEWSLVDPVIWSLDIDKKKALRPNIVITVGGALISRELKEYLRAFPPEEHWSVGFQNGVVDPLKALTLRIEADPSRFLRQFATALRNAPSEQEATVRSAGYALDWSLCREQCARDFGGAVRKAPWSDLKAFSILARQDWRRTNLFLSNGTAVRYAQLFPFRAHAIFCNRGVSGIDGSTSTALGGALSLLPSETPDGSWGSDLRTVLITGDMSFTYDIGALATGMIPDRMKIIVVNNGGGGIFRYIGSTSNLPEELLDRFFCADPRMDIQEVSRAFGLQTYCAESQERLTALLPVFLDDEEAALLEIRTDGALSGRLLKEFKIQNSKLPSRYVGKD